MLSQGLMLSSILIFQVSNKLIWIVFLFVYKKKSLHQGTVVVIASWWKGWCRNNLWLKIHVQWKSKSSDAFISGQCNSVSMATAPWVFRIATLHLNLGFSFLWYRIHNTIFHDELGKHVMPNTKWNCVLVSIMWWRGGSLLTSEKAHRGCYCTMKSLPEKVIQQRTIRWNSNEACCLLVRKWPSVPGLCFCVVPFSSLSFLLNYNRQAYTFWHRDLL